MQTSDQEKISFIKINLQCSNLIEILRLIDKEELIKGIELVPNKETNDTNYFILNSCLDFYQKVDRILEQSKDSD